MRSCSRSTAQERNRNALRRICYGRGHQWRMSSAKIVEQKRGSPTSWVRCPKCEQRKGVQVRRCNKCGKDIPQVVGADTPAGTPPPKRHYCDECAKQLGISPSDVLEPDTEPAG